MRQLNQMLRVDRVSRSEDFKERLQQLSLESTIRLLQDKMNDCSYQMYTEFTLTVLI